MLMKEPARRTDTDIKDIRNLLISIDFICNFNDGKFLPSDLNELARSINLKRYETG